MSESRCRAWISRSRSKQNFITWSTSNCLAWCTPDCCGRRPRGAQLLAVERLPTVPGFIRLVRKGNFVAVVCEREEQALRAARETRLRWSAPTIEFAPDYDTLYDTLHSAPAKGAKVDRSNGNVDDAWQTATRRVESTYEYPFQSHACMGPRPVLWRGSTATTSRSGWAGRSLIPLRKAVAEITSRPLQQVRVIWLPGPGSYGMNDADDAAVDAVLIALEVGRPVRVQYARSDATAMGRQGPAGRVQIARQPGLPRALSGPSTFIHEATRAARGHRVPIVSAKAWRRKLIGGPVTKGSDLYQVSSEAYRFDHKRVSGELIALGAVAADRLAHRASERPRRHGHLLCQREFHRRTGIGRGCRPGRVPLAASGRPAPCGSGARGRRTGGLGGPGRTQYGTGIGRPVARPAASPMRRATVRWWRLSPKSKSTPPRVSGGRPASLSHMTAAWSSTRSVSSMSSSRMC